MNTFKLDIEYDYEFLLVGISCHEKDYRLSWSINNKLGFEFKKSEDLEIKEKRKKEPAHYSLYLYEQKEEHREFYIIANRSKNNFLIPEQKQADYFIMVTGTISQQEKELFIKSLKEIDMVLVVFEIDPNQLKSKEYLLF